MHSFLVVKGSSVNKKPHITIHSNFLYLSLVNVGEATNRKLISAFTWKVFQQRSLSVSDNGLCQTANVTCVSADWLILSVNHITYVTWSAFEYKGMLVLHLLQIAYSITLLAMVHMQQERYSWRTICSNFLANVLRKPLAVD